MFGFTGIIELVVILFVALALFGKRLPGACRAIGESLVSFKKGLHEPEEPKAKKDELPG